MAALTVGDTGDNLTADQHLNDESAPYAAGEKKEATRTDVESNWRHRAMLLFG